MPLLDVLGSVGTLAPAQIDKDVPKLNVGVTIGLTVTFLVIGIAHWLEVGVKV